MAYERTLEDLHAAAEFQFQALRISAKAFDEGVEGEAARLAAAIFILVGRGMRHHTSILDAAHQQDGRRYRSTIPHPGAKGCQLICAQLVKTSENEWTIGVYPRGGGALSEGRDLIFDDWWSEKIIDNDKHKLSRSDLVRILRDKNGGAHFDSVVQDDLVADAIRGDIGAFNYIATEGADPEVVPGGLEACMRQIVEELWFSMKSDEDKQLFFSVQH